MSPSEVCLQVPASPCSKTPTVNSMSPPWGVDSCLELHHPRQLALWSQTFLPASAVVPAGSACLLLPPRAMERGALGWPHRAALSSSIPCHQSTAAHRQPSLGAVLSADPAPEPLPPETARATAAEGEQDGESGGRALGPVLRRGLISDKGYGYLSIVNGYSIKLTGGQRFPLDFESPQGRETKLQSPTFTLLKRKTKHKRDRCNLAACDGWSETGRAVAGEEATENLGWLWGTYMLCGLSSSKTLAIPMPSHLRVLRADPDLAENTAGLEVSALQLRMRDGKGSEHP